MRYYTRVAVIFTVISVGAILAACTSSTGSANDTLPPIITTTTTTTVAPTTTTIPKTYIVQRGDSLSGIAKQFGVSSVALAAFNNITDPDKIQAGQKLKLPQPGDVVVTLAPTTVAPAPTTTRPKTTIAPTTTAPTPTGTS